jgi:hypothetical protein
MPEEVKSFHCKSAKKVYRMMGYHLFRLPPNVQYYGRDCEALAVTVGVGMNSNLDAILASNKKARIGTLALRDLKIIMVLLSLDGARRLLEWIQLNFINESNLPFEPR